VFQTLSVLAERYFNPPYQNVLNMTAGIVFLGTPHPTYRQPKMWRRLTPMLSCTAKFSKPNLSQAELEAAIVANISQKFEETGLDIPVVSIYEEKKTKVAEGWFSIRKELVRKSPVQRFSKLGHF
jgi:hypothetical protein